MVVLITGCVTDRSVPPECAWDSSGGATILGPGDGEYSGQAVFVGDLDGDGRDDVVVGGWGTHDGDSSVDVAWVFTSALEGQVDLDSADTRLLGEREDPQAGWSIAGVGDVDGDGLDDFVVGAPGDDAAGEDAGAVYLFTSPVSGDVDLSAADAKWLGEAAGDQAGSAVTAAGDTNGDGLDDVLIGGPYHGGAGAAWLVLGPGTGLTSLADADAKLVAEESIGNAGAAVAGAGDTDGDGYDDLLVGAPEQAHAGAYSAGAAYLVRGPASGLVDLGQADAIMRGQGEGTRAGGAVAGAGDVDGDGFADLLVGASGLHVEQHEGDVGAVYLVSGLVEGEVLLEEAGSTVTGMSNNEQFGTNLAQGGDLDGDGYADLVIPRLVGGELRVFRGPLGGSKLVGEADLTLEAPEGASRIDVASLGDADGDGLLEVLFGAPRTGTGMGTWWWRGAACLVPHSELAGL
jgi:hypothetical protein